MDGRDAMSISGNSSAYFIHGAGPRLPHPLRGSIRPLLVPNPSFSDAQTTHNGGDGGGGGPMMGSIFQVESSSSSPREEQQHTKRKRGRPRKYGPDGSGSVSLALSPRSVPSSVSGGTGSGTEKRGRGRPPGTGRKQQLATLGDWVASSAGAGFTPHIITIAVGEDIATKIMSFSQQGPRAICILSASGVVSAANIRNPHGIASYEGRYEILCLSGSYRTTYREDGSGNRSGSLTVSLSGPDGQVIGGSVSGLLIAATPVQVIVGSFVYGDPKVKNKSKPDAESRSEHELSISKDIQKTPTHAMHITGQTFTSTFMGGFPRQLDMRNAHINIDLTR